MKKILLLIFCVSSLSFLYSQKGNTTNDCIDKTIKLLSADCNVTRDVDKIPNELLNLINCNKSVIAKYNGNIRLGVSSKPNAKPNRMLALINTSDNKSILFLEEGGVGHRIAIYVYDKINKQLKYQVRSPVRSLGIKKKDFLTKRRVLKLLKQKGQKMICY